MDSSCSSLSRDWNHHIFPSFYGEDVRRGFLAFLLKEFKCKGIDSFNDVGIEKSKSIGPELIGAIRGSRIAVVLLSRNYASSTWCLDELVEIIKCRDKGFQTVMVVFYGVDPSDVKKQTGYFGDVFQKTCKERKKEDIESWRQALVKVAKIAGYHSSNYDDDVVLTEQIATDVSNKLNDSTTSNYYEEKVGIGAHIQEINLLLSLESNDVRMIGIWGPAGIGKTTIATALYRKLSNNFVHTAFVESMRGSCEKNYRDERATMLQLQEKLLSETLNQKDIKIDHLGVSKERLKFKKMLVILDDVVESNQLKAMAKEIQWFGPGSRIIITTKDKKLLQAHRINHIYQVGLPSTSEALEILCLSAFRQNSPSSGFEDMALEVTRLAGDLPLGLSVFGAYLQGMSKDQWIHTLPRLRTSLDGDIEKVLRFSYDALCYKDQELFLHVACFFSGTHINGLVEYLAESGLDVNHGVQVLLDKSLISIHKGCVKMHNLLEQMGKEIVRRQSDSKPGKRQFLVHAHEICDVLEENSGTKKILGIDLDLSEIKGELIIKERAFEGMSCLQFLKFHNSSLYAKDKLHLPEGLNYMSSKLRFLHWENFPSTFLPRMFLPKFLVKLEMKGSKLEKLWEGLAPLQCLKWMDLSDSLNLKEVPNLSHAASLVVLRLGFCRSLLEIPSSVGNATNLRELHLHACTNLVKISSSIGNAINLEMLNLFHCTSLLELPSSIGNLNRLLTLTTGGCSKLEALPSNINMKSICRLELLQCKRLKSFPDISTNIRELDLRATSIEEVPYSIRSWSHLHTLKMWRCKSLKVFPHVPESIEVMDISETAIKEVPSWIQNLSCLTRLEMVECKKLETLPTNINLKSLSFLDLSYCSLLKTFPEISTNIRQLNLQETAIKKVPASIGAWSHLTTLNIKGCKSLKVWEPSPDVIEDFTSKPQLPALLHLNAANCESLKRIHGFFYNQKISLDFTNCLSLNQEATELVQSSFSTRTSLPSAQVPAYFTHRSSGSSLAIHLSYYSRLSMLSRFKACVLLAPYSGTPRKFYVSWRIWSKNTGLVVEDKRSFSIDSIATDHLLTFNSCFFPEDNNDPKAALIFSDLFFVFEIVKETSEIVGIWRDVKYDSQKLTIMECGVRLFGLPHHVREVQRRKWNDGSASSMKRQLLKLKTTKSECGDSNTLTKRRRKPMQGSLPKADEGRDITREGKRQKKS